MTRAGRRAPSIGTEPPRSSSGRSAGNQPVFCRPAARDGSSSARRAFRRCLNWSARRHSISFNAGHHKAADELTLENEERDERWCNDEHSCGGQSNMVFDIDNLKGFLNDTSSFGFIAKENNKIIGFAYCYTLLRPDGKTMFYLHSIGMLPNYQDKGYGSKLLSFIKEYSKEIGCSEMFLITDKGNPRACHVYEKLGGKNDYKDEIVYVYDYEKGDK